MATIVKSLYQAFSTPPLPYHHEYPNSPPLHAATNTHHDLGYFELTINNDGDHHHHQPSMESVEAQEIKRLKRQLAYSNKENSRLKQDHESALARNASLELQLASYKSQLSALQSRHLNELALVRQRENDLKSKHYHLTTLYNDGTALLESRSKELKAAEAFLNMTDERPGEDVFQAVADINNETMQVSAAMADLVQYDTNISLAERPVPASVRLYLSQGLLDELQTRDHTDDPTLVQYALQSCFTYYIGNLLRMFCAGLEPQADHFISNLFEKIQNSDTQAVAARWRVIAHKHCRTALKHVTVTPSILSDFQSILILAGGTPSSIIIPPSLSERIQIVESTSTQLSTLIREKIFSRFYVVLLAEVNCLSQPDYMEDVLETPDLESGKAAPFRVWCCPTLGLGYAVKTQRGFEHKVLLKTQIVGESVIDSLDSEPSDLEA